MEAVRFGDPRTGIRRFGAGVGRPPLYLQLQVACYDRLPYHNMHELRLDDEVFSIALARHEKPAKPAWMIPVQGAEPSWTLEVDRRVYRRRISSDRRADRATGIRTAVVRLVLWPSGGCQGREEDIRFAW